MGRDPVAENFNPEIVVIYCRNSTADGLEPLSMLSGDGFNARFVMMPCSGKVEASHVLKVLAEGADGVEVVGCPDKKCRFLVGNVRAEKRIEYARRLLDEIRMGARRLGMSRGENLDKALLTAMAERRAKELIPLGPNPMKKEKSGK